MKRSGFPKPSYESALAARIALQARQREKASQKASKEKRATGKPRTRKSSLSQRRSKPLKRAGKKVKAWESERRRLVKRFLEAGITECELHGVLEHDCKFDNWLSFAHAAKRRKLRPEDLSQVILICTVAHNIIEVWPAEKMKKIVNLTIESREVQP